MESIITSNHNETLSRYRQILRLINEKIMTFNSEYLNSTCWIELLDLNRLEDDLYFHIMNGKTWDKISFPRCCDEAGVYFYFGFSIANENELCAYIGKASMSSYTGARLFTHFKNAFDEDGQIHKITNEGKRYNIEAVVIIPLGKKKLSFLGVALEEYLIEQLRDSKSVTLLNTRGV